MAWISTELVLESTKKTEDMRSKKYKRNPSHFFLGKWWSVFIIMSDAQWLVSNLCKRDSTRISHLQYQIQPSKGLHNQKTAAQNKRHGQQTNSTISSSNANQPANNISKQLPAAKSTRTTEQQQTVAVQQHNVQGTTNSNQQPTHFCTNFTRKKKVCSEILLENKCRVFLRHRSKNRPWPTRSKTLNIWLFERGFFPLKFSFKKNI